MELEIKHRKECVTFYSLNSFANLVGKWFVSLIGKNKTFTFHYCHDNFGIELNGNRMSWSYLAEQMKSFDDAEIVTDKNENERVMTWLNVA